MNFLGIFLFVLLVLGCGSKAPKSSAGVAAVAGANAQNGVAPFGALASAALTAGGNGPAILYGWLQWQPGTVLQARAIVRGKECPSMMTDQGRFQMVPRGSVTPAFPHLTCEKNLPSDVKTASLELSGPVVSADAQAVVGESLALRVPSRKLSRIVLMGDTGCRLKGPSNGRPGAYQACNDPKQWPFAKLAESAAKLQPDMIIHLGDLHYREAPCPANDPGCAGVATGYDWPAWEADFFAPVKPLLSVAPWVFVRGNHESCNRAGAGWMQFFEPKFSACHDAGEVYNLKFGAHDLAIVDGAEASNMAPSFAKLKTQKSLRWLLVHRPFLTLNQDKNQPSEAMLPEALMKPGQISFAAGGHIHVFAIHNFADRRPPEMIIGHGATALQKDVDFLLKKSGDEFVQMLEFGFVSLDQLSVTSWRLQAHDPDGNIRKTCRIQESYRKKTTITCD